MKKTIIYFMILSAVLVSCAGEDDLTPSNVKDNWFEADSDANDPESVLRRNFYNETKIYLLFNDTLRHEYIGKNADGKELYDTELVDFNYTITNYDDFAYRQITYLSTMQEKEAAAAFVKNYLLPHIKGSKMQPFSVMLVKEILYDRRGYEEDAVPVSYYAGRRCTALAVSGVADMDSEDQESYADDILYSMVSTTVNDADYETKVPFYDISENYAGFYPYYEYYEDHFDDFDPDNWTDEEALEIAHKYGFLSYSGRWSPYFPSSSVDVKDYMDAVWDYTPEAFEEEYGDNPIIMEKYNWMRNFILGLGYKF